MELLFTYHTIKRMNERKISFSEIYDCISYPMKIERRTNGEFRYTKMRSDGRHLLISVCVIKQNKCKIVTVIDSSKTRKYL